MELDDAYANAAYIPDGDSYPARWAAAAAAFRSQALCETDLIYGESDRQRMDIFHPARLTKGLVVFVHGGYWLRFDKSYWSDLAQGPLAHGWSVAIPSYDLCPDVGITQIAAQIRSAIDFAASRIPGPIRLAGHSAGGFLVAHASVPRVGTIWQDRVVKTVPISPVADLAPLMRTSMNADLRIDTTEAASESPVHLAAPKWACTIWVGADERPAFLEQAEALAAVWNCLKVVASGRHHFSVVDDLANGASALTLEIISDDHGCAD